METFLEELDSAYTNLSFLNYKRNFQEIINSFTFTSRMRLQRRLDELLSSMESFSGVIRRILETEDTIEQLSFYNVRFTGYDEFIIDDFVNCVKEGTFKKVVKYNIKKVEGINILTYNFSTEKLLTYSLQSSETVKERVLEYAGAFYHFSLFLLMYSIISDEISSEQLKPFIRDVAEKVNLALLGGFEAYCELSLPLPYSAFYEELSSIRTVEEKKLTITSNKEKETIAFTVKDNSIFHERYRREQKGKVFINYDEKLDKKSLNLFRITKGSKENSIKFIFNRASGQRALSRIFGETEEGKIHPHTLYDSNLSCIKYMIFFCFMAIIDKCYLNEVKPSKYMALDEFIKTYKGQRYVTENIAVIALMAFNPELKEEITEKHLIHKEQRNNILKGVKKLEMLMKKWDISLLECLLRQIRKDYVW